MPVATETNHVLTVEAHPDPSRRGMANWRLRVKLSNGEYFAAYTIDGEWWVGHFGKAPECTKRHIVDWLRHARDCYFCGMRQLFRGVSDDEAIQAFNLLVATADLMQ